MDAEEPPMPRSRFPQFEVDPSRVTLGDFLGKGAFGIVYRATLTRDDGTKDVVVKTVKENASEEEKLLFLEEISAIVNLGVHENLLGLVNCCTVRDHLYLITEFMPYGDLKSFLTKCRQKKTFGEPRDEIYNFEEMNMYQVARQIAEGMVSIKH
ncbi:tyrosine kinase receptor Cad96Ca-like [Branchiostoma lanceolatum]|uniref:tyrosine kinase receptor Cad96Ca-like n=1 Tax=Branchiostoma lanceolatum TaxID=7740 RepID=UPI0034548D6E